MMRSRRSRWMSGIGAVLLIGGLVLANYGGGISPAEATGNHQGNPLRQILNKLNEILAKLNNNGGANGNHTLRWDQALPAAQRFVVLAAFNNDAVLDNNTGLVWEKSPATTTATWAAATATCIDKNVGGQKGYRLPSIPELASLIDPSVAPPGPTLPAGHPFTNVQSSGYWSATTIADNPTAAWDVGFSNGGVGTNLKASTSHVWCVRGGNNADAY